MYLRGLSFEKVDLYKSDSDKFIIGKEGIIPPLKSLQGVGETVARNIVSEREKREFISKEDLINRTKASVTVVEALENHGCLNGLPESNQISLFSVWFCYKYVIILLTTRGSIFKEWENPLFDLF